MPLLCRLFERGYDITPLLDANKASNLPVQTMGGNMTNNDTAIGVIKGDAESTTMQIAHYY